MLSWSPAQTHNQNSEQSFSSNRADLAAVVLCTTYSFWENYLFNNNQKNSNNNGYFHGPSALFC